MVFHEITRGNLAGAERAKTDRPRLGACAGDAAHTSTGWWGIRCRRCCGRRSPKLSAGACRAWRCACWCCGERERRAFRSGTYWDLKALLNKRPDKPAHRFEAQLLSVGGVRVASGRDFDEATGCVPAGKKVLLLDEEQAAALAERLRNGRWVVRKIEEKDSKRSPGCPLRPARCSKRRIANWGWGRRRPCASRSDCTKTGISPICAPTP